MPFLTSMYISVTGEPTWLGFQACWGSKLAEQAQMLCLSVNALIGVYMQIKLGLHLTLNCRA